MEATLIPRCLRDQKWCFFPDYISLNGIAGFAFFQFILEFYREFFTCPFHCLAQVNTRLFFFMSSLSYMSRINFRLNSLLAILYVPLKSIGCWTQVLSVLYLPVIWKICLFGVAWGWRPVVFILSALNLRYRWI